MPDDPHLDLDGRSLSLLVAVHETGSVTAAAQRLGLSQSAVSHGLDRLRALVGDALFVKMGRGIAPTERANELAARARGLLEQMRRFTIAEELRLDRLNATWTLAANDLQCHLLLPRLFARVQAQAPGFRLRVIPSTVPTLDMLREQQCQLVISPRPPEGDDVVQKRLFSDRYRVFHDARHRAAPASLADYEAAEHVSVQYVPSQRRLGIDHWLEDRGLRRRVVVTVANFAGIRAFLDGSAMIATLPSLLRLGVLQGLADSELPFPGPTMPMYAVWHLRHQQDPVHRWLRQQLEAVVAEVLAELPDVIAPAPEQEADTPGDDDLDAGSDEHDLPQGAPAAHRADTPAADRGAEALAARRRTTAPDIEEVPAPPIRKRNPRAHRSRP
ncbi:LysR substrate-binding domain-containing protein [Derxia gummosa]|uniref:LysR substrate-binding domain-containing protein n=1 Tax=Derxia gummosa DSM 723 TaxID=1121388 RepID=A0ABD8FAJ9_9BURK